MSSRWSYQVIEVKVLSRLGQQGWELVNATHAEAADSIRLFLKKPA
jgi:hypothetical protein